MKKVFHLTAHGKRDLEEELGKLTNGRIAIADRIAEARSFGDLSENAEYSAAREEQAQTESRISEIEEILAGAEIIEGDGDDVVSLGDIVTLDSDGKNVEYKIVGEVEANPLDNKISNKSPLGQALIGKKIGDSVKLEVPKGEKIYNIVEIA